MYIYQLENYIIEVFIDEKSGYILYKDKNK